ncbi:MAG: NAD-dependent epimerase/dehydratase family protein [Myxococcales bacterium]|nr:NAD-dependent epimerase/dehydratase family protein [Myxococcales bacterium]
MDILVIGEQGLISAAIVDQLVKRGDNVTFFHNGITSSPAFTRVESIIGTHFDGPDLESKLQGRHFDGVIDLMSFVPEHATSVIRALSGKTRHLIVSSSICVYGGPLSRLPTTEDEPHKPVTYFGRNKSKVESIVLDANGRNGLQTTVLRPALTVGEGSDLYGLLFDQTLPERLKNGMPIIVTDNGMSGANIAHASDVARAFVNALGREVSFGESYHLTGDEHATWNRIHQAMAEAAGGRFQPIYIPTSWLRTMLPIRSVFAHFMAQWPAYFDCTKAKRDLDYEVRVPLVDIFRRQFASLKQRGQTILATEGSFQDIVIETFRNGAERFVSTVDDSNPWGNVPTL